MAGSSWDAHLKHGPWFLAHTEGNTTFRVVNHVLDNGHFMVLGPTRSGKTVDFAFKVAQWFRYPGAQAFPFDVDLSMRCLTLCLGGLHADFGAGACACNPYGSSITLGTGLGGRVAAHLALLEQGVSRTAGLNSLIDGALERLAKRPLGPAHAPRLL